MRGSLAVASHAPCSRLALQMATWGKQKPRSATTAPKAELPALASPASASPFDAFRLSKPRRERCDDVALCARGAENRCAFLRVAPPPASKAEHALPATPADAQPPAKRKRVAAAPPTPSAAFAAFSEAATPPPVVPAALASLPPPFVAAAPGLWRERFAACCPSCFASSAHCVHHREAPLRLLIVGHNPSETAWRTGYPYANGTNRFWRLMQLGEMVPPGFAAADADAAPVLLGLGITDVGCEPGSDAAAFKRPQMRAWRTELYARLRAHCARAAAWAAAEAMAGNGGQMASDDASLAAFASRVIAFSGKRQWGELFEPPLAGFASGLRPAAERPPGWPAMLASSEVWVLPSSSGRAAMTREEREGPYRQLGARVAQLPWPLR